MEGEREAEFRAALPAIFGQQCLARGAIDQSRAKGRRRLRALGCKQIEPGQPFAFRNQAEQGFAAVKLADDFEHMLLERLRRHARSQQPADPQVLGLPFILREQRVGRLLNAIMQEAVGVLMAKHEVPGGGEQLT